MHSCQTERYLPSRERYHSIFLWTGLSSFSENQRRIGSPDCPDAFLWNHTIWHKHKRHFPSAS